MSESPTQALLELGRRPSRVFSEVVAYRVTNDAADLGREGLGQSEVPLSPTRLQNVRGPRMISKGTCIEGNLGSLVVGLDDIIISTDEACTKVNNLEGAAVGVEDTIVEDSVPIDNQQNVGFIGRVFQKLKPAVGKEKQEVTFKGRPRRKAKSLMRDLLPQENNVFASEFEEAVGDL